MIELSSKRTVSPRTAGRSNERFDFGGVRGGFWFEFRLSSNRVQTIDSVWRGSRRGSGSSSNRVQTTDSVFGGVRAGVLVLVQTELKRQIRCWGGSRRGSGSSSNRAQTVDSVLEGSQRGFGSSSSPRSSCLWVGCRAFPRGRKQSRTERDCARVLAPAVVVWAGVAAVSRVGVAGQAIASRGTARALVAEWPSKPSRIPAWGGFSGACVV